MTATRTVSQVCPVMTNESNLKRAAARKKAKTTTDDGVSLTVGEEERVDVAACCRHRIAAQLDHLTSADKWTAHVATH